MVRSAGRSAPPSASPIASRCDAITSTEWCCPAPRWPAACERTARTADCPESCSGHHRRRRRRSLPSSRFSACGRTPPGRSPRPCGCPSTGSAAPPAHTTCSPSSSWPPARSSTCTCDGTTPTRIGSRASVRRCAPGDPGWGAARRSVRAPVPSSVSARPTTTWPRWTVCSTGSVAARWRATRRRSP